MAVNTSNGGLMKPIEKEIGILYVADAGAITDLATITATEDPITAGFAEVGGITTDGVTFAANAEDPEVYLDWNGNAFDSGEATSKPSISFSVLEVLNEIAAKVVFSNASVTSNAGKVTKITGNSNPGNKTFLLDTKIKSTRVRVILEECSFASRGDDVYANDSLYAWQVTYNILAGSQLPGGMVRLFADAA